MWPDFHVLTMVEKVYKKYEILTLDPKKKCYGFFLEIFNNIKFKTNQKVLYLIKSSTTNLVGLHWSYD